MRQLCDPCDAAQPVREPWCQLEDALKRVARLSYLEGQVSLAPAESDDWAEAVLNRPLTSGDRLWLDPDARGELEMGSATLHLDHGTVFGLGQWRYEPAYGYVWRPWYVAPRLGAVSFRSLGLDPPMGLDLGR